MPGADTFPIYDKLLDGKLCDLLAEFRDPSHPVSYERIADAIEERTGLRPGRETVRRWCEACP